MWSDLKSLTYSASLDPHWLVESRWLIAVDYLKGPTLLRFEATGAWEPFRGLRCGPDGSSEFQLAPERMLLPKAAPGCLIGKLGGSTAALDESNTTLFAIGRFAVIGVPDKFMGPLFIGLNLERAQLRASVSQLILLIQEVAWPVSATPSSPAIP